MKYTVIHDEQTTEIEADSFLETPTGKIAFLQNRESQSGPIPVALFDRVNKITSVPTKPDVVFNGEGPELVRS